MSKFEIMQRIVNINEARERLIEIIKFRSFQSGSKIKLASGRSSKFYFNMKPTMLDPEGSYLIGLLALSLVESDCTDLIGGLEMGAVPFATSVSLISHIQNKPIPAFFVRKQIKEHGTQAQIEGFSSGESIKGKRVIVVEDVTTTGKSSLKAINIIRESGGVVIKVIAIIDREEGASETFLEAGVSFESILSLKDFS
ncbi:MAG: Orotate phosphoribosyltransferase [Hyphomicrobiaceae bacterium hypho_1]